MYYLALKFFDANVIDQLIELLSDIEQKNTCSKNQLFCSRIWKRRKKAIRVAECSEVIICLHNPPKWDKTRVKELLNNLELREKNCRAACKKGVARR